MTAPASQATAEARVLEWLREHESFVPELTSRLVRIPSVSPRMVDPAERDGGEALVNHVVAATLEDLGLTVSAVEVAPCRLNVVGTLAGAGQGRSLALNGHIDTVPAGPDHGWERDPWSGDIAGGRVWGRGATDMKGGVAAMVAAAAAITAAGVRLRGDLILQSVCGEELADPEGMLAVLQAGHTADACINCEPTQDPRTGELAIHPVSNGVILLRATLRGKLTHSALRHEWVLPGGRPDIGVNALEKGVDLVKAMQDLERTWAFTKTHPMFPAGKFCLHPGSFVSGPPQGSGPYFPTETCVIEWMIYYHPDESPEAAKAEVAGFIADWALRDPWLSRNPPELEWFAEFPNFDLDPRHPLVSVLGAAYRDLTDHEAPVTGFMAGSDATLLSQWGVPSVVHGPGELSLAHMTNEYVEIDQLNRSARTYAVAALRWCGLADPD